MLSQNLPGILIMVMLRKKEKLTYIYIRLLVVIFIAAPLYSLSQGVNDITIKISFDSIPEIYEAKLAPLKYNKRFALSMQMDDGQDAIINEGFPVFQGGSIGTDTYEGYTYSDGCGNDYYYKMSSAIYTFNSFDGSDAHTDPSSDVVTWNELDILVQNGWGVQNHGVNSDADLIDDFMDYSIQRNRSYTRRMMYNTQEGGVITNVFVNPNGLFDWTSPALDLGCIGALNEKNIGPLAEYGGDVNASDLNWAETRYNIRRHDAGPKDIRDLIDTLYLQSVDGANFWGPIYTHNFSSGQYDFGKFVSDFDYLYDTYGNSETGTDEVLMTTDEEILDYLIIRDGTTVSQSLDGTELTVTFSGTHPTNLLFYDLSLIVNADATINNVEVLGTMDFANADFGDTTMLVNFGWNGKVIRSPEELADDYVEIANTTQTEYDALIAMDYVYTVEYGAFKESLVEELCQISGVTYDEGFCESGYPNFVTITGDSVITIGSSGTLTATSGLKTYWWSTGENTQSITIDPLEDTKYSVQSITHYGDTVTDEIQVLVKDTYFVDHSPLFVHHTVGVPETLWVEMVAGATPLWNNGSTTESLIVDPEETEIYTCSAIVDEQNVQTLEFEVFVGNIIQFSYDSVCLGDSSTMTNTSLISDTIVNILWDLNGDSKFDDGVGEQVRYLYENPGNHLVGMRIIFKNEPMDVVYNPVPVGDSPVPDFDYSDVCFESTTSFFDESTVAFGELNRWLWRFGDGKTDQFQNTSNYYSSPGEYEVMLTVWSDVGCYDSITKQIEIVEIQPIQLQTDYGKDVNEGDTVFFDQGTEVTFNIVNFSEYDSVLWLNNEKGQTFIIADSGEYSLNAYKKDCSESRNFHASWSSSPTPPPGNDIMNLFTPNGDGFNDYWLVNDPNMVYPINVKIYTRSGGLVYENSSYDNTWDGQYSGNPLPQGAYFYMIDDASGNSFKGSVTIIR